LLCLAWLEPVQETLSYLTRQTSVWVEITTLLIPGLNDSDQEIDALTRRSLSMQLTTPPSAVLSAALPCGAVSGCDLDRVPHRSDDKNASLDF
jgi:hypothetical protein